VNDDTNSKPVESKEANVEHSKPDVEETQVKSEETQVKSEVNGRETADSAPVFDLNNYQQIIDDSTLTATAKIRLIFAQVVASVPDLSLPSDFVNALALKLGVSVSLLSKVKKMLLEEKAQERLGQPEILPPVSEASQQVSPDAGGGLPAQEGDTGGIESEQVTVVWKPRQVKALFKMINNTLAAKLAPYGWSELTTEELKDIEEALTPFFNKRFPRGGEKADDIAAIVTLASIFGQRAFTVLSNYRSNRGVQ
jgi:hypothetical protein